MASKHQGGLPDVVIYSKPGCCLCDKAKEQLKRLQVKHKFVLRDINILEDLEVYALFKDEIPVIFVNGRKAFKFRLDEKQFVRLLEAGEIEPNSATSKEL